MKKTICGWEEELSVFHTCLVQGEHSLALSFLFRVLNISSALIKNLILKIRKILLAIACKESRNYRRYFTRQCPP